MLEDKRDLSQDEIDREIKGLDGWTRDGIYIKKDFTFSNFKEINSFLPYLAATIVALNHHPDFCFLTKEKKISVKVTTHSKGGLTQSDIDLAKRLNDWRPRL